MVAEMSLSGGGFKDIDLEEISKWPTPNYINPVRRTWMPAFLLVWQIAVTIMLSGRFYLRARKLAGTFGLDDVLVFLGYLFAIGMTVATWILTTEYGLDRHAWDNKIDWAVPAALTGWIAQVLFVAATVCTKLSILLFHRRMIKETLNRRWVWTLRAAFIFTCCYGVGVLLAYILACRPTDAIWNAFSPTYKKEYTCIATTKVAVWAGVLSVISDLIAVAVPCLLLNHYNLAISFRQKIVLNLTFALGLVATGAGVARTYYLWKIRTTMDSTWVGHTFFAWSIVECQLAIMCACAPSLRAFFRRYVRDTLKRSFGSGVSHYATGTGESFHKNSQALTEDHNGRVYQELRPLESGVHGVQYPPPVILDESAYERRVSRRPGTDDAMRYDAVMRSRSPSPVVTTPDEFECYANERMSRQGQMMRDRQSRTESIVVRMDVNNDGDEISKDNGNRSGSGRQYAAAKR
ncbi:hypothetical protein CB0940_10519 [Cercospora beticola]|uniref:Rhodopsin domain-containing protein n=2 Tax=Cercospora beticola TaxID=122368 RepID=A0A2G5HTD7_CERBT|nr:hypothetical protein CB0940_10519 [Cercospora beticola]PIA95801.1 hypothetical protein CB0940_10519 [Cercospora beticola]CAK1367208.1 unnamed protein product [Cercospora beticola]